MGLKSSVVIFSHIGYEKLMFELCCVVNFEVITHRITVWVSPLKLVLKISWVSEVLWMLVTLKSRAAFSTLHTWSRWLAHIITILIVCLMQRLIGIIWPIGLWIVNYLNVIMSLLLCWVRMSRIVLFCTCLRPKSKTMWLRNSSNSCSSYQFINQEVRLLIFLTSTVNSRLADTLL